MNERDAARLLSGRNRASVIEKEALFARIFSDTKAPKRSWLSLGFGALAAAGLAAVVLVVVSPRGGEPSPFGARGGSSKPVPSVAPVCVESGRPQACRIGDTLGFRVEGARNGQHLALLALGPTGEVLWFEPSPQGQTDPLGGVVPGQPVVLPRGARLTSQQPAGRYELVAAFADRPLTRAALRAELGAELRGRAKTLVVVRHGFVIEPAP